MSLPPTVTAIANGDNTPHHTTHTHTPHNTTHAYVDNNTQHTHTSAHVR